MTRREAIVIGAGPAGSAAAIGLTRAGADTLLLERARVTGDALCGGFLSWQTLAQLDALGIDRTMLGGQIIRCARLFAGPRRSETMLPAPAMGVSRLRLDGVLQRCAAAAGVPIEYGVQAASIEGGVVRTRDGAELSAKAIFLATGKHGLRGFAREPADWQNRDPVMGLRLRLPAHPGLARLIGDSVELHLFDRGYAGLVQQEDGSANLCLAVHKSRLDAMQGDPATLIQALGRECPYLGERLAYADWSRRVDAIGHVPYGWRARDTQSGLFRLGDQAGVIPSLAGEGMGLAIASADAAVLAWCRGGADAAPSFQRAFAARLTRPFAVANGVWRAGEIPIAAAAMTALASVASPLARWAMRATRITDQ